MKKKERKMYSSVYIYIYHKSSIAVTAFEAGFMIRNTISCQHLNEMNSLVASLAFLLSPTEGHFSTDGKF
jgi:hypothetical protein